MNGGVHKTGELSAGTFSDHDRINFLNRLCNLIPETHADCFEEKRVQEEISLQKLKPLEAPIQQMVARYLDNPEIISNDELLPVLEKAIHDKHEASMLPFYKRQMCPGDVSSDTLLHAAIMIENRSLFEDVREMMEQAELNAYRQQREDPFMSKSDVGPLVPTPRLVGQALVKLHQHPILQQKVRKVISLQELKDIDHEMAYLCEHSFRCSNEFKWL
jgi:hypothetical protein